MKIRMIKTIQGSLDGVTVGELVEGKQYDTVDSPRGLRLANYHIRQGAAVLAPDALPEPVAAPAPVSVKRPAKEKAPEWTE